MHKIVIIGAGQCGRGYLARLVQQPTSQLTFIDQKESLIRQLKDASSYQILFSKTDRAPITIQDYEAYTWQDPQALQALCEADYIFTSIGEQHLQELVPYLQEAKRLQGYRSMVIITAENGTSPKQQLLEVEDAHTTLSEAVIFCTTLQQDSLDILSEDLDYLPYDADALQQKLPYPAMIAQHQFQDLLERKIYTYNCLSACIAYPGELLHYENYAEAANDPFISCLLQRVCDSLTVSLSKAYDISFAKQDQFTKMAIQKFQNRAIQDTIERNTRDVKRKLGKAERIFAPIRICREAPADVSCLLLVCACAIRYAIQTQSYDGIHGPACFEEILSDIDSLLTREEVSQLRRMYDKIEKRESLSQRLQEEDIDEILS